jgi:hypothetical protein
MNFIIDDALKEHMQKSGKTNIVVELVTAETSDIEISELHVHLVNDRQAAFFKEKKRYRAYEVDGVQVLLPRFPLECQEDIRFWLKSFLCFKTVGYEGMKI